VNYLKYQAAWNECEEGGGDGRHVGRVETLQLALEHEGGNGNGKRQKHRTFT
jgi:hypothetical protein